MTKQYVSLAILMLSVLPFAFSNTNEDKQEYMALPQGESTFVSGYISANTTWTLADSPYIVVGDVIVESGVTLTIEPGVLVKFTSVTNLVIDGSLSAIGNSTHKIAFTSNSATPSRGDWGSINIRHYSTTNSLGHVSIEYASTALTLAANCSITNSLIKSNNNGISLQNPAEVYIGYIEVTNNTGSGISGSISQSIIIENSNVSVNGNGVSISGGQDSYPQALIKKCTITKNTGTGIGPNEHVSIEVYDSYVSSNVLGLSVPFSAQAYVQNCTFLNNEYGVSVIGDVINSTISGNLYWGIHARGPYQHASFNGCSITDNGNGIEIGYGGWISIYSSEISNNGRGIYAYDYKANADVYSSVIRNNSISGVWLDWGDYESVYLYYSVVEYNPYGVYIATGSVFASQSAIISNTYGILAYAGGAVSSGFQASFTAIANNSVINSQVKTQNLQYCNIYNSPIGIQLESGTINYCNVYNHSEYNVKNTAGNDINAAYNWWGTTDEAVIKNSIYDYYDNYTIGKVRSKPYQTAQMKIGNAPPWDITGPTTWVPDRKCDIRDIAQAAKLFGYIEGDGRYDKRADINGPAYLVPDSKIDIRDIALIAKHFGETYT